MRRAVSIIQTTTRDVWRNSMENILHFMNPLEFLTAWFVLLFISLIVAPLILIATLALLLLYPFLLLFRKKKEPGPPPVANLRLKEKYRQD